MSLGLTFSRAPFLELGCFAGRMDSLLSSQDGRELFAVKSPWLQRQQGQLPSTHGLNS